MTNSFHIFLIQAPYICIHQAVTCVEEGRHLVVSVMSFRRHWVVNKRCSRVCWFSRALRFIWLTSLRTPRRASPVTTSAADHASQDTMKWIAYCARRRHVVNAAAVAAARTCQIGLHRPAPEKRLQQSCRAPDPITYPRCRRSVI